MGIRFAIKFDAILGVFGIEPHVNEVFRQHPRDLSIVHGLLLKLSAVGAPICVKFKEDWFVLTSGLGKTVVEAKPFNLALVLLLR